jgi:hypothetical protein
MTFSSIPNTTRRAIGTGGSFCRCQVGKGGTSPLGTSVYATRGAAVTAGATTAQTDPVLTNELLKSTSIMIDTFLDYAFIYDGGLKRHWIMCTKRDP